MTRECPLSAQYSLNSGMVIPPFRELQVTHTISMFSSACSPPRTMGVAWSNVSFDSFFPQYEQYPSAECIRDASAIESTSIFFFNLCCALELQLTALIKSLLFARYALSLAHIDSLCFALVRRLYSQALSGFLLFHDFFAEAIFKGFNASQRLCISLLHGLQQERRPLLFFLSGLKNSFGSTFLQVLHGLVIRWI